MGNTKVLVADDEHDVSAPDIESPVDGSGLKSDSNDARPTGEGVSNSSHGGWHFSTEGWGATVEELLVEWSDLPPSKKEANFEKALSVCKEDAETGGLYQDNFFRVLGKSLVNIYRLHDVAAKDKVADKVLRKKYEAAGIRVTKSTKNEFTPFVNWVFGKKTAGANRTRYASALLYAKQQNIRVDELVGFLKKKGGIVGYAARITEQRNKDAGLPSTADKAKELVETRMANAPKFRVTQGSGLPKDGVFTGLFTIKPDGNCFLLGWRPASTREVLSYGRTKPAVSARRKRP